MTESDLTQGLQLACEFVMPFCEALKHADRFNKGYPDMTVTWRGPTSWWEIKHYDNEPFHTPPQQVITCQKLASQGICYYVIYEERKGERRTLIVPPCDIKEWRDAADFKPGFDHGWVAQFIRHQHYENHRR